ncbi:endonuclease G, mitochondrial-like [Branchiostoma lanceolatum]|uniref:endonuclease G, mitochondrial-like n=1 Tax=Branchiostoma lanceolatum TaxID=7740 RepID=UPI003452B8EE
MSSMSAVKSRLIPAITTVTSIGVGVWLGVQYERKTLPLPSVLAKTSSPSDEVDTRTVPGHLVPVTPTPGPQTSPGKAGQIMRYGFPGLTDLKSREGYVVSYDRRNRNPHWVFEHLTSSHIRGDSDRQQCDFKEDETIHPYFRATNWDFKRSGYDRGHLAAAANHRHSQTAMGDTFYLSNISPQVGEGFNRDAWNKLEKYVRGLTKQFNNVYVCTGPLYLPRKEPDGKMYVKYEVIGRNHVAVPTHFFKVIACETNKGELILESYVMPNDKIDNNVPLKNFLVPVESIERASGLLLFDRIPRNAFKAINGRQP